jgi:hypothetical protein
MPLSATVARPDSRSFAIVYEQVKTTATALANCIREMSGRITIQLAVTEKLGTNISLSIAVTVFALMSKCHCVQWPNDPSSAPAATRRNDCNSDARAGFAAAHSWTTSSRD